jgi:hypothetical protein
MLAVNILGPGLCIKKKTETSQRGTQTFSYELQPKKGQMGKGSGGVKRMG